MKLGPPPVPNREEHPYQGTLVFQGIPLLLEHLAGSERSGVDADGKPWSVTMTAHYGEIADTEGMDGDPIDVFVGPNLEASAVYVVHQKHPGTQIPDEDKCVLGCDTAEEAEALYRANYTRPGFFHGVTLWDIKEFKAHLRKHRGKVGRMDTPPRHEELVKAEIANRPGLHLDPVKHRWVLDAEKAGRVFPYRVSLDRFKEMLERRRTQARRPMDGKPDELVTVYRGGPHAPGAGDYVSMVKKTAVANADRPGGESWPVHKMRVPRSHLHYGRWEDKANLIYLPPVDAETAHRQHIENARAAGLKPPNEEDLVKATILGGTTTLPTDLDEDELARGILVEQEHTPDIRIATEIALDHLNEIPDYYTRLAKMERQALAKGIVFYIDLAKAMQLSLFSHAATRAEPAPAVPTSRGAQVSLFSMPSKGPVAVMPPAAPTTPQEPHRAPTPAKPPPYVPHATAPGTVQVSGHWRTLPDGKVVWVRPHERSDEIAIGGGPSKPTPKQPTLPAIGDRPLTVRDVTPIHNAGNALPPPSIVSARKPQPPPPEPTEEEYARLTAAKERSDKLTAEYRENWEYPWDVPDEAIHPADFKRDEKYTAWVRNEGTNDWRLATFEDAPGYKPTWEGYTLTGAREQDEKIRAGERVTEEWERTIETFQDEGREVIFVAEGVVPNALPAQWVEVEGFKASEDNPPNFLGLKPDAFQFSQRRGDRGYQVYGFEDDPWLEEAGFFEAMGEDQWKREFFAGMIAQGKDYDRMSPKMQGIYGSIARDLAAWWTDLNDDERATFWTRYCDDSKQHTAGKVTDPRHENAVLAVPPGMEKFSAMVDGKGQPFRIHEYQRKAVNFAADSAPRCLWAMEMGLGKTLAAQTLYHHLKARGEVDRMIITAPVSAHGSWEDHFKDFSNIRAEILTGASAAQRQAAYERLDRGEIEAIVISPDTVSEREKKAKKQTDLDKLPVGHSVWADKDGRWPQEWVKQADGTWQGTHTDHPTTAEILMKMAVNTGYLTYDDPNSDVNLISALVEKHGSRCLRIADEVHKFKNPNSARSRGFWKAITAHDGRVVGMTGTPKPNGAEDFYHVVDHIAPGSLGMSIGQFARDYAYTAPAYRGPNEIMGFRPEKLGDLYAANANVLFARTTGDPDVNLVLPDRIDLAPRIPQDETQRKIEAKLVEYMEIRHKAAAEEREALHNPFAGTYWTDLLSDAKAGKLGPLDRAAARSAPWTQQGVLLRWQQLAIDPRLLDADFAEDFPGYKSPKLQAVVDATKEHLTQHPDTGAVVFCEYNGGIEAIKQTFIEQGIPEDKIGVYTGASSGKQRRALQKALNEGTIKILLGNTAALETGANLQKRANFVAHLNTPWAPDRLTQSTARVHRQGQSRKVTVFRPTGSPVEELIERVVSRKLMEASQATGRTMQADAHVAASTRKKGKERLDRNTIASMLGINPEILSASNEKIKPFTREDLERLEEKERDL